MSVNIQQVTKIYGEQKAVDNISFEVKEGEILGFLGPNGAGKSTTMKMITGFLPMTEGQIFVNGIDMQKNPIEGRKLIGYLPENNPLYQDMYVKEYLHFILEQLSDLDDISYRSMMGEYILYYRGKIVGGVYDDRLLVKKTRSALGCMPAAASWSRWPSGYARAASGPSFTAAAAVGHCRLTALRQTITR